MLATVTPDPLGTLPPDIASQLATLSGLLAPLAVSAIRRRLAGRPKWVLPALCAILAVAVSSLAQLAASLASDAETGGWVVAARVAVGVAWAGLGLLGRELNKGLRTGERIDDRPVVRAVDRTGRYRGGGKLGIGIAALLLPAAAGAQQPLGQGVGFPVDQSWAVTFRNGNTASATHPEHNPWNSTGLPVDLVCCPATWTTAQREAYWASYCRYYGDTDLPPATRPGSAQCARVFSGPAGPTLYPHGVGRYPDLVLYGELLGTGDLPSAIEMDLLIRSHGATRFLWQSLCSAGDEQSCLRLQSVQAGPGNRCNDPNWICDPLALLPVGSRPPIARVGDYRLRGGDPEAACAFVNAQTPPKLFIVTNPQRADCFDGLSCSTYQEIRDLGGECWDPPPPAPICGDGNCDATEGCVTCPADCGPCEPTEGVDITVTGCGGGVWELAYEADGESGTATVTEGGTFALDGVAVTLPACGTDCPEADVLDSVRAVEGVCQ